MNATQSRYPIMHAAKLVNMPARSRDVLPHETCCLISFLSMHTILSRFSTIHAALSPYIHPHSVTHDAWWSTRVSARYMLPHRITPAIQYNHAVYHADHAPHCLDGGHFEFLRPFLVVQTKRFIQNYITHVSCIIIYIRHKHPSVNQNVWGSYGPQRSKIW